MRRLTEENGFTTLWHTEHGERGSCLSETRRSRSCVPENSVLFMVSAGLGYDFVNPKGDRAFYQSLTLKTFITKKIYINTGYRLGSFKDPQNLMLGIGFRL